jgi:hypothetical protein
MKHDEQHPEVKFGQKMPINMQAGLKGTGHVLITKFSKARKIGCSSFLF